MTGYTLSKHAAYRIRQRGITDHQIAEALAGETWGGSWVEYFYCRHSRLLVVTCPVCRVVITLYTLTGKQARVFKAKGSGGWRAKGSPFPVAGHKHRKEENEF